MFLRTTITRSTSRFLPSRISTRPRGLAVLAPAAAQPSNPQQQVEKPSTAAYEEKETRVEFYEHCRSRSDCEAAELEFTAYGKATTKPDEEIVAAEVESRKMGHDTNPLDVSSANPQSSEVRDAKLEGMLPDERLPHQGMMKGVGVKQGHCKKYD